jgi:twinfilin-like protein
VSNGSSIDGDLEKVSGELNSTDARYVLFNKGGEGASWILMSHVPDQCKVKDKMLYASTRATVKRTLGANFFAEEMHGTLPSDFNAKGYADFKAHTAAAVPLTRGEYERQEELERGEIYTGGASTYVHGVAFPAEAGVDQALKGLVTGSGKNYVALGVDTTKETITLRGSKSLGSIADLRDQVSLTEPQFHFMRYKHEEYDEIIFIFTCPDGSGKTTACPIKQRMLYSSSKARVVQLLEGVGGTIAKSFEFNEPSDVEQDDIDNALHPPKAEAAKQFAKPARPGRGARKLIR